MGRTYERHVILGAGGAITHALLPELIRGKERIVLVSRSGCPVDGADTVSADVTDYKALSAAVPAGSVVYLLVGLPYDIRVWREQWPRIMDNVIRVCREKESLLVFFDNVYMYGRVEGPMSEDTPHNPTSKKGEVRARIADQLMGELSSGRLQGVIARSADFYGPGAGQTGLPNLLIVQRLVGGKSAQWLGSPDRLHSLTYTTDCGRALPLLVADERAYNQVWHLPTAHPPIAIRRFVELAAAASGARPKVTTMPTVMLKLAGLFDRTLREISEMLYQNQYDYVFDSTKFENHFAFTPTSYEDGVVATVKAQD